MHAIKCFNDCVGCIAGCTGLERCGVANVLGQTCCNFFDMNGSCVEACPANSSPNAELECECDFFYLYHVHYGVVHVYRGE